MNKLLAHRYLIKQNLIALIGLCLCVYFSYHTVRGERSLMQMYALSQNIETMSLEHNNIKAQRERLEKKVVMMRPGTINKDLLEEQVRLVLGYSHSDEVAILRN